jgi:hypothetical protein
MIVEKQSMSESTGTVEQLQPTQENSVSTSSDENRRKKKIKGERVKAAFNLLDHFLTIYNSSETYIRRAITLFGLGTVIAGVSFGAAQQINSTQQVTSNRESSSVLSKQQPADSTPAVAPAPKPQTPSVIYVPVPTNHTWTNHTPVQASTSANSLTTTNQQQVVTPQPVNTQPQPNSVPTVPTATSDQPQVKSVKEEHPMESVDSNSDRPKSIKEDIEQAQQVVEDVKAITDVAAPLKDLF